MSERKITAYDLEISDRLKRTRGPFADKMAHILLDKNYGDIAVLRSFADAVIALESIKEELFNELIKYKVLYGEMPK